MQQTRCSLGSLSRVFRDRFFAHSPVTFVQLVQDSQSSPVHVLEDLQLRFPVLLSGHLPDLCAVLLSSRFIRHSAQVHTKPLNLLWLLGQVPSSGRRLAKPPQEDGA